ncbi:hypothetical protein QUB70_29275 [Microcoleus sp. A003_D6]|uniref:hypothetical protein n=1 Tax=Microcoleus sp. A003_D6 TaxID=3055266 RepID=UPI002FD1422E
MLSESSRLVYGEELITATELNRQPGRVLDLAMRSPYHHHSQRPAFCLAAPRRDGAVGKSRRPFRESL